MAVLSEKEIRARAPEGWELVKGQIQKVYTFKAFVPAIRFVNKVADIAEAVQHHPDITVNWNKVTLTVSTHSEGGVTEKDIDVAGRFNDAAASV